MRPTPEISQASAQAWLAHISQRDLLYQARDSFSGDRLLEFEEPEPQIEHGLIRAEEEPRLTGRKGSSHHVNLQSSAQPLPCMLI